METAADYALATDSLLKVLPMTPAPVPPDEQTYAGRFSVRLRELRRQQEMTVPDMVAAMQAEGFMAKQTTIYNWESGRAVPPMNVFPILAKVLKLKSPRSLLPRE